MSFRNTGPGGKFKAVTPSNSTDLPDGPCRAFHVNVAGNVKFTDLDGNTVTLTVVAGLPMPYSAVRIWADSTATGITAIYDL